MAKFKPFAPEFEMLGNEPQPWVLKFRLVHKAVFTRDICPISLELELPLVCNAIFQMFTSLLKVETAFGARFLQDVKVGVDSKSPLGIKLL